MARRPPDTGDDTTGDESAPGSAARGGGLTVRAWGGAGLSVWTLAGEKARRISRGEISVLGPALGLVLAYAIHKVSGPGIAPLLGLFLGFPLAAMLIAAFRLRTTEKKRETKLFVEERALRFEGGTAPIELPFERTSAFLLNDAADGRSVRVTLRLLDGDPVHIEVAAAEATPLIEALDARLASSLAGTGLRAALLRRGRPLDEWRAALQKLSGAGGYRGGSLPVEPLLSAVRDDRLGAEERIGAALALGGRSAPEHREKLRIAAREVRTTALRLAVDHVLDGTIDEADLAVAAEEEATAGKGTRPQ